MAGTALETLLGIPGAKARLIPLKLGKVENAAADDYVRVNPVF